MTDYGRIARRAIDLNGAIQRPDELERLLKIVHSIRPQIVLEIGTHTGGTLWAWMEVSSPSVHAISIDIDQHTNWRPDPGPGQSLSLIESDSLIDSTRQQVDRELKGRSVDFLFIDGDHSAGAPQRDWELYSPLVREGGVAALHDVLDAAGAAGGCWQGLLTKHTHQKIIGQDLSQCGGLGGIGVVFL